MSGLAYYNEIDKYAAQWLRNLIDAGHIAPGIVDERSIEDVRPEELRVFNQCHFFAGIGVWSLALRRAGVADSTRVWTVSCPCQPFSAAGKGAGFADERHLWPAFHWLIEKRRPAVVLGEQVASRDADPWIDLVCDDLEAMGYAVGAVPFPSAGVGAPHIRDRIYWVAHAARGGRRKEHADAERRAVGNQAQGLAAGSVRSGSVGGLAHAEQRAGGRETSAADHLRPQADGPADRAGGRGGAPVAGAGPVNGFWRHADWVACRDGKRRPVEPGTFPLAHGSAARVGRLRAYGNAVNAIQAQVFIEAARDAGVNL